MLLLLAPAYNCKAAGIGETKAHLKLSEYLACLALHRVREQVRAAETIYPVRTPMSARGEEAAEE